MKTLKSTLLLIALCATTFLTTSCDKDKKDDPDPRDAYVGTYEMATECGGDELGDFDLEIEKDAKSPTGLIITSEFFEELGVDEVSAELEGNKIVLDAFDIQIEDEGEVFELELEGEGRLSGKTLSLDLESDGNSICDLEGDKK